MANLLGSKQSESYDVETCTHKLKDANHLVEETNHLVREHEAWLGKVIIWLMKLNHLVEDRGSIKYLSPLVIYLCLLQVYYGSSHPAYVLHSMRTRLPPTDHFLLT